MRYCGTFNRRNDIYFSISIILRNRPSRPIWIGDLHRSSLFLVMGCYALIRIELGNAIKYDLSELIENFPGNVLTM